MFIYITLVIVMLAGLLAFPVVLASAQANYGNAQSYQINYQLEDRQLEGRQQDPGGNRPTHSITIQVPYSPNTWANIARRATLHSNVTISVFQPVHAVRARIITGDNNNPGLVS